MESNLNTLPKYGLFVSVTLNYMSYLNALLNSIEKRELYKNCRLCMHVFYYGDFPFNFIKDATEKFSYEIKFIKIMSDEIPLKAKTIEYVKRVRYHKIIEYAGQYDAVCMLDCDMYFVSNQFNKLMDMVSNKPFLIGCNERYKWESGPYTIDGEKIIADGGRMYQFICNTPAIFDMSFWKLVFEKYIEIAVRGRQEKNGSIVGIGDIFCWNLAIASCGRGDDIITFPMETMAQVHHTNTRHWTYPIVEGGHWRSFAGDRIYVIHGRVGRENMVDGCMKKYYQLHEGRPDIEKVATGVRKGLVMIENEWNDLNHNCTLNIDDYFLA